MFHNMSQAHLGLTRYPSHKELSTTHPNPILHEGGTGLVYVFVLERKVVARVNVHSLAERRSTILEKKGVWDKGEVELS